MTRKISISNIAWEYSLMDEFMSLLASEGADLELSPSMVWKEPVDIPIAEIKRFKIYVDAYGLRMPSMHSLTYPRPDLLFFATNDVRKALVQYIADLGKIAHELNIPVMVFGSSKSRFIGDRNRAECLAVLANTFHQMAEKLAPLGVTLLIEPLSKQETDSINNMDEAYELMQQVDHKNFAMHADLKSSFAENEDQSEIWSKYVRYIKHCHVANLGLKPPTSDCKEHTKAAKAMLSVGYDGYVSIEMGRCNDLLLVKKSIEFVRETYC